MAPWGGGGAATGGGGRRGGGHLQGRGGVLFGGRGRKRRPGPENTCLDEVFGLKNVSNFAHDDVILGPSKAVKVDVLNNHLNVRGPR